MSHLIHRRAHPIPAGFAALVSSLTIVFAGAAAAAPAQVPDFGGIWGRDAHNMPKPYSNNPRGYNVRDGYNNEYLKPWVVELLTRDALVEGSGKPVATAHSVCYPEGVPYAFGGTQIQILQAPTEITMIFADAGQVRTIYLNRPHPQHIVPSWYGDSVGHFEGDTLVVDTVGIAMHPEAGSMGFFGTPHTDALHLVERYRFLAAGEKSLAPPLKNESFASDAVIKGGRTLRLEFTVDDPGAYKKPWSITLDFLPLNERIREYVCAENSRDKDLNPLLPTAAVPDF